MNREFVMVALVALGGALGSVARYLVASAIQRFVAPVFPYGTFTVNIGGCFVAGALIARFEMHGLESPAARAFVFVGVLGGFTTFSTFGLETFEFINDGQWNKAILNVLLSNTACLVAVWLGYRITERIVGA